MAIDLHTSDLFGADDHPGAGSLACGIEVAATMSDVLEKARQSGVKREEIAERMSYYLGERLSVATINSFTSIAQDNREISFRRAMAFDAATRSDVLLDLYCGKRGNRQVITTQDAVFIELGRIHHQERELAERKRVLQIALKGK